MHDAELSRGQLFGLAGMAECWLGEIIRGPLAGIAEGTRTEIGRTGTDATVTLYDRASGRNLASRAFSSRTPACGRGSRAAFSVGDGRDFTGTSLAKRTIPVRRLVIPTSCVVARRERSA
ncbi:MAG: hypothetical protein Q8Q09_08595 [Deltaproteobacteria bacterium]|nr:hypothetical protein [Deltaproteobacteria bacterium]